MTATVYTNNTLTETIRLSKDRKTRNLQIGNICKTYERKNVPCYIDIKGGDIRQ